MSGVSAREGALAWRGEPAHGEGPRELPPEAVVGELVRRDESARVAVQLSDSQLRQLALEFAAVMGQPAVPPQPPQPPPPPELPFFGELCAAWYEKVAPTRVVPENERRQLELLRPLSLEDESTLTAARIEAHLDQLGREKGLSPSTLNKIQATGRRVVEEAQRAKVWTGTNPFKLARRRKEPLRKYELLTLEECQRVQSKLTPDRRAQFRIALHLGLRPGELFALRREDIDFAQGIILVRRSHEREETKTGSLRVVPIVPAIAGDLLQALDAGVGELLFPAESGNLQRRDTKTTRILRTAMAAAGVGVLSVTYKCRRCGRQEVGPAPAVKGNKCQCGFTHWPVPEVRPVRWYDLRHMAATFHHRAGADPICIALALGHTIKGTTGRVYTHPDAAKMRAELSKWSLPL